MLALRAALAALGRIEPALESAVENLVHSFVSKKPLTPALKHLEAVADAKALGLNPAKV
jgi:hypothetical protein